MAAENRTLSGSDESAQAALDYLAKDVTQLWEDAKPLWKRWTTDPNVRGDDYAKKLKGQGLRHKVVKEVDGGNGAMCRVDFVQNNAVGRADQGANFLNAGNAQTQTLTHAYFPGRLYQAWMGVGFQDRIEIQGGPAAMYDYVAGKVENNIYALSENLADALWGYGYVTDAVAGSTQVRSLDGLMGAVATSNVVGMDTAADRYYGGINRITAANADWRGNTVTISAPLQISDVIDLTLRCDDGNDRITLYACGRVVYGILCNMTEAKNRIINEADPVLAALGPIKLDGTPVMLDKTLDSSRLAGTTGSFFVSSVAGTAVLGELGDWTAEALYAINENYFNLFVWKGAHKNGAPLTMPVLDSTTNLNRVYRAVYHCALAGWKPRRSGALINITT